MNNDMARQAARLLLLPTWMVAFAILIKGYSDSGDGFSGGVIAALGVIMQYVTFGTAVAEKLRPVRYARQIALTGLLLALATAFTPVLRGQSIMTHFPGPNEHATHIGSLELTTPFLFDIGVFLLVMGVCVGVFDLLAHATRRDRS
ncbi:MAG: MnhB domain-containing protein [Thermomicrobiales bacterium]|nr:MnhB domain-containing protein [Thermomicrobiales bacterium]